MARTKQLRRRFEDSVEISSDEDDPQPPPESPLKWSGDPLSAESNYVAQSYEKDDEIKKLRKIVDEIEEELICELCKLRMWLPYRLTECGHVFCLGCLLTSFDDIHTRFLNANPGYTPLSLSFKEALREPLKFPSVCYEAHVHMAKSPHPEYTCPSCQNAVTRRPVEELKVKKLVMCLSSVQGIKPPQSTITAGTDKLPFEGYHFL